MTEITNNTANELFDAVSMALQRLHKKDPDHELLNTFKGMLHDEATYASFVKRFGDKNVPENLRSNAFNVEEMYRRYLMAIQEALGELPSSPTEKLRQEISLTKESANDNETIHF